MNKDSLSRVRVLSALVAATLVVACGGGGSDAAPTPPPPPPPPPPPASVIISGKAVDGALQGATACYDLNDNKACDTGEPASAAASDAGGNFTISVLQTDSGKHRVIVNVPATAIDADTGAAVGKAFTLVAPATGTTGAQSVFVSPLTTLVLQQADNAGQTLAQATEFVQAQLGLAVSPLADFTTATNTDNAKAANAAKLALQTSQQQATAVAAAVGQTDVSGAAISQSDLDKAVVAKVISALPSIGAAAADPALSGLTGTAREQALIDAATKVVTQIGFTPDQAKFDIGLPKLPPSQAVAPASESAVMPALQYTNAANWFYRYNASTGADNTVDANGKVLSYHVRTSMAPFAYQPNQGVATSANRTFNPELHWTGSAWGDCKVGERETNTLRDALGRSSYASCNNHEKGSTQRGAIDIAGQTLASVWTNRIAVEVAKTTGPTSWSLPDVTLLGTAVFPAGSLFMLQTNTVTDTAPTYNNIASNRVTVFSDAVAQGGDARLGPVACSNAGTAVTTTSLDEMVARYPGKPCISNPGTNADGSSLVPNEGWGATTISLGNIANGNTLPAGTGNYYNTNLRLRVAFTGPNNATTYYRCYERRADASTRNCTPIGTGSYSVEALGDARVMSFANLPLELQGLASARVFVERGGAVYFGFKNKVGAIFTSVRLNLPAANAMLSQLGMPRIQPTDAPQALPGGKATAQALLKGAWGLVVPEGAAVLRVGDNGQYILAQASPPSGGDRPGVEYGWLDIDPATGRYSALIETDSNGEFGLSHPQSAVETTTVTDTTLTFGSDVVPRLVDDPNGIVGMWALGSPTDLRATHFVFFNNGKLLSIHPAESEGACATARQGPPGIEWSDYSFNAGTGVLTISNKIYDTSGCTGVFDSTNPSQPSSATFTLTMAADKKSFTVPVDGGAATETGYRIAPR